MSTRERQIAALITGLTALACGGGEPSGPPVQTVARTAIISRLVPTTGGCEWRSEEIPAGGSEVLATLPPCRGPAFAVELDVPRHRALLRDAQGAPFVIDTAAKTGVAAPPPPVPGATLGLASGGLVACAIVVDAPLEAADGSLSFTFDGASYSVAEAGEGGTSLARDWRWNGQIWTAVETAVIESPSPDAGPGTCEDLASFGRHALAVPGASPALRQVEAADLVMLRAASGEVDASYVQSEGDHPFAVREEWGEGPSWIGPLFVRSGGGWRPLIGTGEFLAAGDEGLVFAQAGGEWRLYSTETGEILWRSADRPTPWGDLAL